MSIYAVNKFCHRIYHDDAFRSGVETDPVGALDGFQLTPQERTLLQSGEVGRLYELGAHPFLLAHLTRASTFGVTIPIYSERMRAAHDDRLPPLEAATWLQSKS